MLTHQWTIVQDAARVGLIVAMDSRLSSQTCNAACATAVVRDQMRRVGAQVGLEDRDISLGTSNCNDAGMDAWLNEQTAWRANQQYVVCVQHSFQPFGPFMPQNLLMTTSRMEGRRLP